MSRGRNSSNWCFTFFDEPENEIFPNVTTMRNTLEVWLERNNGTVQYVCGQEEESPTTGAVHFQGYLQLKKQMRMPQVKKLFGSKTIHLEAQKAPDSDSARNYCMKNGTAREGTFVEAGQYKRSTKGKRTDVTAFRDAILTGRSLRALIELYPNEVAKFPKFFQQVTMMVEPSRPDDYEHEVILCFGDPGTGKTRWARDFETNDRWQPPLSNGTMWFDGYDQHRVAILDDFSGAASKITLPNTLALFDRYPVKVPIKGGHCWWMPEVLIVTTNIHPRGWFDFSTRHQHWEALKRRFTKIMIFQHDHEGPYQHEQDPWDDTHDNGWNAVHKFDSFFEDEELWPDQNRVTGRVGFDDD